MPANTEETRLSSYGEAALYLDGDREAVNRQLKVLIAEALLALGCRIPRERPIPSKHRVLISTVPDTTLGCWYEEVSFPNFDSYYDSK